jgi:hypothetical protein
MKTTRASPNATIAREVQRTSELSFQNAFWSPVRKLNKRIMGLPQIAEDFSWAFGSESLA